MNCELELLSQMAASLLGPSRVGPGADNASITHTCNEPLPTTGFLLLPFHLETSAQPPPLHSPSLPLYLPPTAGEAGL